MFTERVGIATRWGIYLTAIERQALDAALALLPRPTDALELGCQGGRWSEVLVGKGWRVTCTDVDETALDACRARLPTARCVLVKPEDRTIPCEDGSADFLLCIEVPPVIQSDWFPAEAHRVLRPGGVVLGVIQNKRSLRGMFVRMRERFPLTRGPEKGADTYTVSYGEWKRSMQRMSFRFHFQRGFCWFPFSRTSDSPLVPACSRIERVLGLQKVPAASPWVAFVARKSVAGPAE